MRSLARLLGFDVPAARQYLSHWFPRPLGLVSQEDIDTYKDEKRMLTLPLLSDSMTTAYLGTRPHRF